MRRGSDATTCAKLLLAGAVTIFACVFSSGAFAGEPGPLGDEYAEPQDGFSASRNGASEILGKPGPRPRKSRPIDADCDAYAADYADRYLGSGDPTGDIVSGAMAGAVGGGAWEGPSGAQRGAAAGGALAVLGNLAAYPGGWEGLYDMAYQMCRQQKRNSNAAGCTSNAEVNGGGGSDILRARSKCR